MRNKILKFTKSNGFETTEQRSAIMRKIRSSNTKPEIELRKALWGAGLRYRLNVKKLSGSPDIVINKYKIVVFVDGEFWHGFNWEDKKKKLKTNREFWIPKIERNMQRDLENNFALESKGYFVIRFWEREINKNLSDCVKKVLSMTNCHILYTRG